MGWSLSMRRGALLSALVSSDADLSRAAPALLDADVGALRATMETLAGASDRRAQLTALASNTRPAPSLEAITSPRERALLASSVADRETAEAWLANAPAVRRGYRPARGLARTIVHAARGPAHGATGAGDRGRGRALLAVAVQRADDSARRDLLAGIGADEAASILALAAHPSELDPPAPALRRAASLASGDDRVDALGALRRGATAEESSLDQFVRGGRELAELGLLGHGVG